MVLRRVRAGAGHRKRSIQMFELGIARALQRDRRQQRALLRRVSTPLNHLNLDRIIRLITLTILSFGLAAIIFFRFHGASSHVASAGLLICLITAEWFWIFDGSERERLLKVVADLLNNRFFKPQIQQGANHEF